MKMARLKCDRSKHVLGNLNWFSAFSMLVWTSVLSQAILLKNICRAFLPAFLMEWFTQPKMNNLFWPYENSIEQYFAAHLVQGFQQYCSTLLHPIAGYFRLNNLFSIVDNIKQCW